MRRAFTLLLAIAAMQQVPAAAQETGTLRTHRSAEIDDRGADGARRTMDAFTACLVSRGSGRAVALTRLRVDSDQYRRTFRNLYDNEGDECLAGMEGGTLSFSTNLMRGGLFQALYAREFGGAGPTDFSAVASTGYGELYAEGLSPESRTALALEQFGECVSRADAAGVQSLLRARPGSSGEREAIAALSPRFAACIPREQTIRFSPSVLKGALAEGIYRLSVAARGGASASR